MRSVVSIALVIIIGTFGLACSSEPEIDGKKINDWISLLRHDDWTVQAQAQDTIARLGKEGLPFLKRGITTKDPTLRRGTIITLGKIGEQAKDLAAVMLKRMAVEEVSVIRAEILKSLALIDPRASGVPEEFKKRLRDQDAEVREAAQAGLELLKPPKKAPVVKEKDKPKKIVQAESYALREVVAEQLKAQGVAFGIVAEVVREDKRAAIVWPVLKEGKIIDDDLIAYVFEKKKDKWILAQGNIGMSKSDGPNKLAKALGGADKQRVVRPCGVERDKLASFLEDKGKGFSEALAAGKADDVIKAFEELTRAFSFRLVAYDDMLPEMLINNAFSDPAWKIEASPEKKSVKVEISVKGKAQSGTLQLGTCGGGTVISNLKPE
ncbi:MAG: HEAT repeat domain-containing protein [Deltaproteobacteria bacterium]|nr:HEAT repeat domain-containing protein [Deltaproteobacteria bacterium]MBW1871912.1 HEAT repeat domain-containing protein [Deltaproteobacteria bacterium]